MGTVRATNGVSVQERTRPVGVLIGVVFAALALAACGDDDDVSQGSATQRAAERSATPTAIRDADGFTPAEREVVDAAERYTTAILNYQKGDRSVDLTEVATKELADSIAAGVKAEFDDKDKVLIGKNRFTPEAVEIKGDRARFRGCSDFSRVFTVKKGETTADVGDKPGVASIVDFRMVREDGTWLVSDPSSLAKHC